MFGLSAALALLMVGPRPVVAQERTESAPAHISLVEGSVVLERDGRTEAAPSSMPVLAGDRLRTNAGRVEILFADGSTLHLDSNTLVDFQSDDVIRLLEGRVRLHITGPDRTVAYRIDAPSAWVQIGRPGEYRVALLGGREGEVELAVLRGFAELVNEDGRTALGAGERAYASPGAAPSNAYVFNSAAWDAFDRWSEARRDERLGLSAQYLPADVRSYSATLDRYGAWQYETAYGYVWYPRVGVGWRPYYHGRWAHLRPYGWTWVGADPWAWATHHYGRWGFSAGAWFWIPGRHWGPAWVSWAYAPGYVSWCPLGFNNRPVFSFVSVNIFGGRRFDPWHGWTVLPHRSFGAGRVNVGLNVVNVNRINVRSRQAFVTRDRGPDFRGYAVPRGSVAPIRTAGTGSIGAVPRDRGAGAVSAPAPRSATPSERAGAFQSRGSSSGQLSGPGLPAPSRAPRSLAPVIRGRAPGPSSDAVERNSPSSAPAARGAGPRAVPRQSAPNAPQASPGSQPSRRAVPQYDGRAIAPRRQDGATPMAQPSPGRYRVSPRSEGSASAPPSAAPERMAPRSPESRSGGAPRAMPRSSQPSPPPAYRSNPGMERGAPSPSRPSGPPPSAAPSRPSGPPASAAPSPRSGPRGGGGATAPASRSRGGQQSRGTAVRRGG
jgi:hypothetical protein